MENLIKMQSFYNQLRRGEASLFKHLREYKKQLYKLQ